MHLPDTDRASPDAVRRRIDADPVRLTVPGGTCVRRAYARQRAPAEVPDPARLGRALVGAFMHAELRLQVQSAPGG